MTPRNARRMQKAIEEQQRLERNGAPPEFTAPEIASRMTKPKEADALYQVFVDIKGENGSRPVSPKFAGSAGQEACTQILSALNAQICLGKLKGWGNARLERAVQVHLT